MCQLVIDINLTSCSASSLHTRQSRQHIAELPTKSLQNKHGLSLCQISTNKHLLKTNHFSLAKRPQLFQYLLRQHATILYILPAGDSVSLQQPQQVQTYQILVNFTKLKIFIFARPDNSHVSLTYAKAQQFPQIGFLLFAISLSVFLHA